MFCTKGLDNEYQGQPEDGCRWHCTKKKKRYAPDPLDNPDIFITANHHETGETSQQIARVAGAGFFARMRARGEAFPFVCSRRAAFKKINRRLLRRLLNETVFCRTLLPATLCNKIVALFNTYRTL